MSENKIILTTKAELESLIEVTIRKVLSDKKVSSEHKEYDHSKLLSLKEASEFLKLAPQTIYGFTSKRIIPFRKRGKKLYFKQMDLEKWIEEGKKKSISELKKEADQL